MSNLEKYLKSEEGYIKLTPEIEALAEKITEGATTDAEKADKIYDYMRDINYFISPAMPAPSLIDRKFLDCGSKHTLQASLLRSQGIPARINLMECPITAVTKTLEHIRLPKMTMIVGNTALNAIGEDVNYGTHYALDAHYDDEWHFQDATVPPKLCKYFTGEKKEECLSRQNASALLGCRKIGHTEDLPSNGVIISVMGKLFIEYMDQLGLGFGDNLIEKANSGEKRTESL